MTLLHLKQTGDANLEEERRGEYVDCKNITLENKFGKRKGGG